jgi:hypothetical protein
VLNALYNQKYLPMNINIWTAKIFVVFKIIEFVFLYMRDTLLFVSEYFLSVLHLQYELISLTSEYLEEISRKELYRIHV